MLSKSAKRLSDRLKIITNETIITSCDMEDVMEIVMEDGYVDSQEERLLNEIHKLITNKTLSWGPC